jgi:serine/threonine protein kinase
VLGYDDAVPGTSLAPGAILQNTYRIVRRVGGGGMGEVYEARHDRLSGRYAVKVLGADMAGHPEALLRFRREAQVTSSLQHPGIVQVIDFNETSDGVPYLVMEYLDGGDLAEVIARAAPLPVRRVASRSRQRSRLPTAVTSCTAISSRRTCSCSPSTAATSSSWSTSASPRSGARRST